MQARLVATITTALLGIIAYWLYKLGAVELVMKFDKTYLTFVIAGMFALVHMNFVYARFAHARIPQTSATTWFMSNIFGALGIVGTVIGLMIIAIGMSDSNFNPEDTESFKVVILNVLHGMGTAFLTTIAGQCASISLKLHVWFLGDRHEI